MPRASDSLNQGVCDPTPYVVDLDPRQLADLERKFSQGMVIVQRDCKTPMKILADCSVKGSYAGVYTYAGTSSLLVFTRARCLRGLPEASTGAPPPLSTRREGRNSR